MSDIDFLNDNLEETSSILGASYTGETYESTTPDEIALLISESSVYSDITVNKSGDSEVESGNNSAVKVTGSGNSTIIKDSTINSTANYSQGVYCNNYANVSIEDTAITVTGDNTPAIASDTYGGIELTGFCTISVNGEHSPVVYAGEDSGIITIEANIEADTEYLVMSDYDDYRITFEDSTVSCTQGLGYFTKSGAIEFSSTVIESNTGIVFEGGELGEDEDKPNSIVYLENNNIQIADKLFDLSNVDYYISIKHNEDLELATLANIVDGSKGTFSIREQNISGNITIDNESSVKLNISDNSTFIGAIVKSEGESEGNNYRVNLSRSTWVLTADTFLTELIVDEDSVIDLDGHTLTVNDVNSNYEVGHIVNYKATDNSVKQQNLVIIKLNENDTCNLYDTDDYVTYNNVSKSEITFTGRILDDIDDLLADIDARVKESHTSDEIEDGTSVVNNISDSNGILVNNETKEYTDITVAKSGDTAVGEPTITNTINNAAVLVTNSGRLDYHSSSVTTDAKYSAGLVAEGSGSVFNATDIDVTTDGENSVGVLALNQGTFNGNGLTITTLDDTEGSYPYGVVVDDATLTLISSSIESSSTGVIVKGGAEDVTLDGVIIDSDGIAVSVVDSSSLEIHNSTLNKGIYVDQGSYVEISTSTINTEEAEAYYIFNNGHIDNSNNTITVSNAHAILIDESTAATLELVNDIITNTGEFSAISVLDSTAQITIDNTVFNTEDIMLRVINSTVDLIINGDVTGDIEIDSDSTLNVTINGNYNGLINNTGLSGTVNVIISNTGTWTLTATKDSYIQFLTIEDNDNTRVVYIGTSRLFVNDESFINRNDEGIDIDSGYSTKLYPTQRTLKICNSEELPDLPDRDPTYMYLVYDKMELHLYQSKYSDPFCIVETLPTDKSHMTDKMIYITFDGYIYCYTNYKAYQLGTVENFDPDQLEILTKCGTIYFLDAATRYIDKKKRTIQLPFKNGNYQLNLSLFEDVIIDENTTIRFNPETEQFYVAGKEYQFDNRLNNIHAYTGRSSNTVRNRIDRHTFRSEIKISEDYTNDIVARKDGLYVSKADLAKIEDYDRMILAFSKYKQIIDGYMNELRDLVSETSESVSEENVLAMIHEALETYQPTIDEMFSRYDNMLTRLGNVETTITTGLSTALESAKDEIKDYINQTNSAWTVLTEEGYVPIYTDEQISIRGIALPQIRSQIAALRESADPEEERIGSEGIIYDVGYTLSGLTEDETSVQEYILNQIMSIMYTMDEWVVVSEFSELTEPGNSWTRYFVVNNEDEENPVYQEYQWVGDIIDPETMEVTTPAHYELIYDLYA